MPHRGLATEVVLDVSLEELESETDLVLSHMRDQCPVAFVPSLGRVLVTTWDLCAAAGADDGLGPSIAENDRVYGAPNLMSMSGESHKCLRRAVGTPFRPRPIREHRDGMMRSITERYLTDVSPCGSADLLADVLEPISQRTVGDLLGFTDVDDATLNRWFHRYSAYLVDHGRTSVVADEYRELRGEIAAYLAPTVSRLTREPDDSVLSRMVLHGRPDGVHATVDDLAGTVGLLIVGGFQEPAHLIATTVYGLLSHPDQAAHYRSDTVGFAAAAVEEGLRWIAPFSMAEKCAEHDVPVGDLVIPSGTEVGLVIGSANRDPRRFTAPEVFDLTRPNQANQAFGYGLHFCVGHAVARNLAQVVVTELFDRLPNLRLDPDHPPTVQGFTVRGVKSLAVQWDNQR